MLKITVLTDDLKKNARDFYEYTWAVLSKNHFSYYLHDNNLKQDDTNNVIYYTEGNYTYAVKQYEESTFKYDINNVVDVFEGTQYKGSLNITSGQVYIEQNCKGFTLY